MISPPVSVTLESLLVYASRLNFFCSPSCKRTLLYFIAVCDAALVEVVEEITGTSMPMRSSVLHHQSFPVTRDTIELDGQVDRPELRSQKFLSN